MARMRKLPVVQSAVTSHLGLRTEAGHPLFVLRQPVADLPPGRLGASEHVQLGADAGIVVEQSGGDADRREICSLARRERAADAAKEAKAARCRLELLHKMLTRKQPELVDIDVNIAGEGGSGQLPAVAAMTVGQSADLIDFESDASAEAAPLDHRAAPVVNVALPVRCDGSPATCHVQWRLLSAPGHSLMILSGGAVRE